MAEILERPLAPARHRLDVGAYYRMAEAGILTDGHRVELIDGDIIDMAAIGSPHAAVTNRLARLFTRALRDEAALVNIQSPLRLDAYNEPEPDLMILRPRADDYHASHPTAARRAPPRRGLGNLLAYDRATKLPLYAQFGVPEVWIVDLVSAAVEIYRRAEGRRVCVARTARARAAIAGARLSARVSGQPTARVRTAPGAAE